MRVLLDVKVVKRSKPRVIASACKALLAKTEGKTMPRTVEGVGDTRAIMLIASDGLRCRVEKASNAPVTQS